jgi:hypothetical protein
MRRVLAVVLAATVAAPTRTLAQTRPDFSGTWTRVDAKSDPALGLLRGGSGHTIKQTATEIVVTIAGRGGPGDVKRTLVFTKR